jgi:hypothetical protein
MLWYCLIIYCNGWCLYPIGKDDLNTWEYLTDHIVIYLLFNICACYHLCAQKEIKVFHVVITWVIWTETLSMPSSLKANVCPFFCLNPCSSIRAFVFTVWCTLYLSLVTAFPFCSNEHVLSCFKKMMFLVS